MIFEKEGVYLHTNAKRSNQETTIPGFIRIVERVSKRISQACSEGVKEFRSVIKNVLVLGWGASVRVDSPGE